MSSQTGNLSTPSLGIWMLTSPYHLLYFTLFSSTLLCSGLLYTLPPKMFPLLCPTPSVPQLTPSHPTAPYPALPLCSLTLSYSTHPYSAVLPLLTPVLHSRFITAHLFQGTWKVAPSLVRNTWSVFDQEVCSAAVYKIDGGTRQSSGLHFR